MQQRGVNYWDTYSPVVNWMYVRAILILSLLIEIHTNSVDFVLAYTQNNVKTEIFVELPIGFGVEGTRPIEWIRLYKNHCVLKDAGLAWFEKLKEGLEARGFFQLQAHPCVWYREEIIQLVLC